MPAISRREMRPAGQPPRQARCASALVGICACHMAVAGQRLPRALFARHLCLSAKRVLAEASRVHMEPCLIRAEVEMQLGGRVHRREDAALD